MGVYFARPVLQMVIGQAFTVAGVAGEFDVMCTVKGGGLSGQAGAVKHGISQALIALRAEPAPGAEGRGLPDPRQPRRRAQEVRQAQGAPQLPVLQALSRRRRARPAAPAHFGRRPEAVCQSAKAAAGIGRPKCQPWP